MPPKLKAERMSRTPHSEGIMNKPNPVSAMHFQPQAAGRSPWIAVHHELRFRQGPAGPPAGFLPSHERKLANRRPASNDARDQQERGFDPEIPRNRGRSGWSPAFPG
jgi:hypothetical protein